MKESQGYRQGGMFNNHQMSPDGVNNYDNPDVIVNI